MTCMQLSGRPCGKVIVAETNTTAAGVYGVYEDWVYFACDPGWWFPEGRVSKKAYCNHTGEWEKPPEPEITCASM